MRLTPMTCAVIDRPRWTRAGWSIAISLLAAGVLAGTAAAHPLISSNWAGYAARIHSGAGRFQSVSGVFTQPLAACSRGQESYVGVWVGLGGYASGARALEQIGTDSDCTKGGRAVYSAWFELVPAPPIPIAVTIRPGDQVGVSVTVHRHRVTLRLRDYTTGSRFSVRRRTSPVDVSSAEWIVEAPSTCLSSRSCATLPLTDFGTASFLNATATAGGRTMPVQGPGWSTSALELHQGPDASGVQLGHGAASAPGPVAAVPSILGPGGAFSVTWVQRSTGPETPEGANFGPGA
jgi:Peptidase A4 family